LRQIGLEVTIICLFSAFLVLPSIPSVTHFRLVHKD
jgi:hypothetical protein